MKPMMFLTMAVLSISWAGGQSLSGTYTGYAWKDEVKGASLENTSEKIVTTLSLDVQMDFLVKTSGAWVSRLDSKIEVGIDYSKTPSLSVPETTGQPYQAGVSLFTVKTADKMSLYLVGVDFGIDAVAGATKTAQNSVDGISGATVRMSRESESYQRALVAAKILKEEEVIKGRF